MDLRHLSIYLNDHLAGATVGRELARRMAGSNRDNDYGPFLAQLAREVDEDREALLELMRALEIGVDHLIDRARRQYEQLDEHRHRAVREALAR